MGWGDVSSLQICWGIFFRFVGVGMYLPCRYCRVGVQCLCVKVRVSPLCLYMLAMLNCMFYFVNVIIILLHSFRIHIPGLHADT